MNKEYSKEYLQTEKLIKTIPIVFQKYTDKLTKLGKQFQKITDEDEEDLILVKITKMQQSVEKIYGSSKTFHK